MARRYARWKDAVGTSVAALWPVVLTLGVLRNPGRYSPYAVYSGLGSISSQSLSSLPTTDANVYGVSYALGLRAASMLVHGHVPWWNSFEGLGAPLIGELQAGGLFPFTPLLLIHDGSLVFHLALEVVAAVATYWLLREYRCSPVVAAAGGMLFATNGTFAWLANAAFDPICFLPLMLLGVERSRRAAAEGTGGGWRWLAAGTALAILAGFIETAALGLILVAVVAVQRAFTLDSDKLRVYARKAAAGLAAGIAIAAPVLVAFQSYLQNGFVAEHAGNAAAGRLGAEYTPIMVAPYLYGPIRASINPAIHSIWGAVGGYAGFALLALAVASLFGKRDRGLRIALAAWVVVSVGDTLGVPGIHTVVSSLPVLNHIVLYRYFPPTWELALVILAAFALRDLATSSRAEAVIAVTTGILASSAMLLVGILLDPRPVQASRALVPAAFHRSELLIVAVIAGLLLAVLAPTKVRGVLVGIVVVAEAAVLFAVPLLSWPAHDKVDTRAATFLAKNVGSASFFSLGAPAANFGSLIAVRQLNIVDLPVPKAMVPILASLDPYENPTSFTGMHRLIPGAPTPAELVARNVPLFAKYGVRFIVAPTNLRLFGTTHAATLVYRDATVAIWRLPHTDAPVRAVGCTVATRTQDSYVVKCARPSVVVRTDLWFPGWSASVNGAGVAVRNRGGLQVVTVPAGRSVVAFTFLPPGVPLAAVASIAALVSLAVPWGLIASRRRRRRAEAEGLEQLGETLAKRAPPPVTLAGDVPLDLPTGAVEIGPALEDDAPTSAVPAVAGATRTAVLEPPGAEEDPPTSTIQATPAPASAQDPPTLAVPVSRAETKKRRR